MGTTALAGLVLLRHATAQAEALSRPPAAVPAFHRFQMGSFTVTTLFDGTARLPLDGMATNAPADTLRALLAEAFLPTDGYLTPYTVTLLQTSNATVLFDAGTGGQLSPQAGRMGAALAAAGVAPNDITHVVLTHCHGDHITGLTTVEGQAVFAQAEGRVKAQGGLEQPAFRSLLELMRNPRAWAKICGAERVSSEGAPFHDALPFARALVEAAPDRILWGTDWPHPNVTGDMPNDGDLIDLLAKAVEDEPTRYRILVDNPAQLYWNEGEGA